MPASKAKTEMLPLDKLERMFNNPRTQTVENVPALDPKWVEELSFVKYCPPPLTLHLTDDQVSYDLGDQGEIEEWKERMIFLEEDLKYLLQLSHSSFWCQVVFDESLSVCLDSYLHFAPRSYDAWYFLPPDLLELEKKIHRLIFMVYLRMSTHKESKEHFFTPDTFGEILYENFLFDIPKIMDICTLYGTSDNKELLRKMMDNVFSRQPMYMDDFCNTVPSICEMFDKVQAKCGFLPDNQSSEPRRLSESRIPCQENAVTNATEITDVIYYLSDASFTLHSLVTVIPSVCHIFHQHEFINKLATLIETVFPWLEEKLKKSRFKILRKKLKKTKMNLLMVCQCIIYTCTLEPLHRSSMSRTPEDLQPYADEFFNIILSVLSEKRFLSAYNRLHNIETEIDITRTAGVTIDELQIEFILSAVESACKSFPIKQKRSKAQRVNQSSEEMKNKTDVPTNSSADIQTSTSQIQLNEAGAVGGIGDVEIESMLTHVKELFPHLGEGFIMECLEYFDYNMEHLINLLLEDNLPVTLSNLDKSMPRKEKVESVLDERHSVFDSDEFDVFSKKKIDTSKVQIGKRHQTRSDFQNIFDDKSVVHHMKELMQASYTRDYDEYDDEYDDTYDTHNVGAQDADSADELDEMTLRRPFVTPRVLGGATMSSDEEEEEDDNEEGTSGESNAQAGKPSKPEREQSHDNKGRHISGKHELSGTGRGVKWKGGGQGKGTSGEGRHGNQNFGGRTASGGGRGGFKGKGHVQSGSGSSSNDRTVRDRANKDKHKASRANHNRKAMADKKRNKGMGLLPQ